MAFRKYLTYLPTYLPVYLSTPQVSYLRVQSQDPPASLAAGQQAKQQLMIEVMKPFDYSEAPLLTVTFRYNRQSYSFELSLPVVPTSFFEPVTLPAQVGR